MGLQRDANLADGDAAYAAIIEAHADLTQAQSLALNARLVLLLANHIGDAAVLREALETARKSLGVIPASRQRRASGTKAGIHDTSVE